MNIPTPGWKKDGANSETFLKAGQSYFVAFPTVWIVIIGFRLPNSKFPEGLRIAD